MTKDDMWPVPLRFLCINDEGSEVLQASSPQDLLQQLNIATNDPEGTLAGLFDDPQPRITVLHPLSPAYWRIEQQLYQQQAADKPPKLPTIAPYAKSLSPNEVMALLGEMETGGYLVKMQAFLSHVRKNGWAGGSYENHSQS